MTIDKLIQIYTLKTLAEQKGNRTQTAKALGISVRTLRNYINEWREQGVQIDTSEEAIARESGSLPVEILEEDLNCMRSVTPEERDEWSSKDFWSGGKTKKRADA